VLLNTLRKGDKGYLVRISFGILAGVLGMDVIQDTLGLDTGEGKAFL
jgi:hypothetical protein